MPKRHVIIKYNYDFPIEEGKSMDDSADMALWKLREDLGGQISMKKLKELFEVIFKYKN